LRIDLWPPLNFALLSQEHDAVLDNFFNLDLKSIITHY
jgi:hypothetical protein